MRGANSTSAGDVDGLSMPVLFIAGVEDIVIAPRVEGARLQIHAPLIQMSKADIVRKAVELDVDLSLTHSCYDPMPDGRACGKCDSCQLRLKGFREAGIADPIKYASK